MGIVSALVSLLAMVGVACLVVMCVRYASKTDDVIEKFAARIVGLGLFIVLAIYTFHIMNGYLRKIDTPLSPQQQQLPEQGRAPAKPVQPKIDVPRPDPFHDARRRHQAEMDAFEQDTGTPEVDQ